ncbi:MAG: hypothetical protein SPI72_04010 [Porphyromonas sp.]|nr:hypothetical protein [Porphyromonas sp.]
MEAIQQTNFRDGFFARIGKLLYMEIYCNAKTFLTLSLVVVGLIFGGKELFFLTSNYVEPMHYDHVQYLLFCLFVFYVAFTYYLNRRVNTTNPMAYPIVPASTAEKFISIWIIGFIYLIFALLANQLAYTLLWIVNGGSVISYGTGTNGSSSYGIIDLLSFSSTLNPLNPMAFIAYELSTAFTCCIAFRKYIVSALSWVGIMGVSILVPMNVFSVLFASVENRETEIEVFVTTYTNWTIACLWVLVLFFFCLSYYLLRRKQI